MGSPNPCRRGRAEEGNQDLPIEMGHYCDSDYFDCITEKGARKKKIKIPSSGWDLT